MPKGKSPADAVLHALGFALFRRESSGALRAIAGLPAWLTTFWPGLGAGDEPLDASISPFLENFLIDAEECWRAGGEQRACSGPGLNRTVQGELRAVGSDRVDRRWPTSSASRASGRRIRGQESNAAKSARERDRLPAAQFRDSEKGDFAPLRGGRDERGAGEHRDFTAPS